MYFLLASCTQVQNLPIRLRHTSSLRHILYCYYIHRSRGFFSDGRRGSVVTCGVYTIARRSQSTSPVGSRGRYWRVRGCVCKCKGRLTSTYSQRSCAKLLGKYQLQVCISIQISGGGFVARSCSSGAPSRLTIYSTDYFYISQVSSLERIDLPSL